MEIDRRAPVVAVSRIQIAAEPDVVWDTIADFERWPAWNPDVKGMSLDGPVAEGMTFRWKAGPGTITSTLRCVERPREIGWTGTTLGIAAVHVWRFERGDRHTLASTASRGQACFPGFFARRCASSFGPGSTRGFRI